MTKIVLTKDPINPLAVNLRVDLQSYCEACKALRDNKRALTIAKNNLTLSTAQTRDSLLQELAEAELRVSDAQKKLAACRELLLPDFSGLGGALHWVEIKKIVAKQCDLGHYGESQLSSYLNENNSSVPLVIESLNDYFIELLKNSVDAILTNYFIKGGGNTSLEMHIAFSISEKNIAVTIRDNAGGFPSSYLDNFSSYVQSEQYKMLSFSSEKANGEYFLGGAGKGMRMLLNLLLNGELLEQSGKSHKLHHVNKGETSIQIENVKSGAQIILTSPFAPSKCIPDILAPRSENRISTSTFSTTFGTKTGLPPLTLPPDLKKRKLLVTCLGQENISAVLPPIYSTPLASATLLGGKNLEKKAPVIPQNEHLQIKELPR